LLPFSGNNRFSDADLISFLSSTGGGLTGVSKGSYPLGKVKMGLNPSRLTGILDESDTLDKRDGVF
jgi:hypothetical protein